MFFVGKHQANLVFVACKGMEGWLVLVVLECLVKFMLPYHVGSIENIHKLQRENMRGAIFDQSESTLQSSVRPRIWIWRGKVDAGWSGSEDLVPWWGYGGLDQNFLSLRERWRAGHLFSVVVKYDDRGAVCCRPRESKAQCVA